MSSLPQERNKAKERDNVARLGIIDARLAKLDQQITTEFPDYSSLANPPSMSISEVQKLLQPEEALLLLFDTRALRESPDESFAWVVTKTNSRWFRSKLGTAALRDHVDALRCGLDFEGAWIGERCFNLLNRVYTEADYQAGKPLPFDLDRAHALYRV